MANLLNSSIITGDSSDTIVIRKAGDYFFSIGAGDPAVAADYAAEDFEDAVVSASIGAVPVTDGRSPFTNLARAAMAILSLPAGTVIDVVTQNTTTACRITVICRPV